ncbi:MAG: hypothetical protein AB1942_23965 [Pseudomonadota bacterium]
MNTLVTARAACALALAVATFAGPAAAVPSAASQAAKGRVTPISTQVTDPSLPTPARKALDAKAEALLGRILATPALADPHGFSIRRSVRIHAQPTGMPAGLPAMMDLLVLPQEVDLDAGAKPDAAGTYMGRLEGPPMHAYVNNLLALYANYSGGGDPATEIQYLPIQRGVVQGFPVYRVGVKDVVLITKPGRKPWVNVTKGEYLQKQVAETRKTIADIGGPPHPRMQQQLDEQTAALARLSPADRAAPACASSRLREPFGDCAARDATFYVRPNLDYFDRGAPRGAVQLVMIATPAEGGHGHPRLEPKLRAAGAALDYRAIQAALD